MVDQDSLFDRVLEYPDPDAKERYERLIGLDEHKDGLLKEAASLLDPAMLEKWSATHYETVLPVVREVINRTPLVVLAGDVGTGKTELAESLPDTLARSLGVSVTLYPLSLSARGRGGVGEMTTLLTEAFKEVSNVARSGRDSEGMLKSAVILLIDEGDALAQSRELDQMHHEDRAGVNALIRGIDGLRRDRLPVLTIISTNREAALDPAVLRRAARILRFSRPSNQQRLDLLSWQLNGSGVDDTSLSEIVRLTGPREGRDFGCTYSDLRQRYLVEVVLDSLETGPLSGERLIEIADGFVPTPPFRDADG